MAYQYQYINRLIQFNKISIDLILTDDEDILPTIRIEKQFCSISTTDEDLDTEANREIEYYTNNQPESKPGAPTE